MSWTRTDLSNFAFFHNFQLCSPNELFSVLKGVHHQSADHHQSDVSASLPSVATAANGPSPIPAGRSIRPKGLQSISEVLLTGASGILGAQEVDLSSTKVRPSESVLRSSQSAKVCVCVEIDNAYPPHPLNPSSFFCFRVPSLE